MSDYGRPWTILLLDEITVDLDLLTRENLMSFLKRETVSRDCSIVYATHILDNMAEWPTTLIHMCQGGVKHSGAASDLLQGQPESKSGSLLGNLVLEWLQEDFAERVPREKS